MTARSFLRLGVIVAFAALAAAPAFAQLPETLEKVDKKAPCFRWPAVDLDKDGVPDRIDRCDNTPLGAVVDEWGCPIDTDHVGVYDGLDKCPDTPPGVMVDANGCSSGQLAAMSQHGAEPAPTPPPTPAPPPPAPVSETERQLVEGGRIRLENVYFETASAKLLPESETTLNEVGAVLEKFVDLKLEVQGHSDSRGAAAYNLKLSQARAESVRQYLLDHFHLNSENLVAKGYGETQLEVKPEHNDEDRQRNRRVVIKVLNPEDLPHGVKVEHR